MVNCTQSTFCMTRTYRLHLRRGERSSELQVGCISDILDNSGKSVVITERGCAQQVYQYQALERGKWKTITTILEETYTAGCVKDSEWAEHRATDTEYCYCHQDRCNDVTNQEVEEEEGPIRSDYQDNFIESHGLQVNHIKIPNILYFRKIRRWLLMELRKETFTT